VDIGFFIVSICLFVCPQHNSKTNDPKVLLVLLRLSTLIAAERQHNDFFLVYFRKGECLSSLKKPMKRAANDNYEWTVTYLSFQGLFYAL